MTTSKGRTLSPRRYCGFTLMEMLLAMTIVCMISGAAFASLHIAFSTRRKVEWKLTMMRKVEHALTMIHRDLLNCPTPGGEMSPTFEGEDSTADSGDYEGDVLTFYTRPWRVEPQTPYGGIIKVVYELGEQNDGESDKEDTVLFRRTVANVLAATEPDPDDEVVLRGVKGFSVSFYDGSDWSDEFDSEDSDDSDSGSGTLPIAVLYKITLEDEETGDDVTFQRMTLLPCATEEEAESAVVNR